MTSIDNRLLSFGVTPGSDVAGVPADVQRLWKDVFDQSRVVAPRSDTVADAASEPTGRALHPREHGTTRADATPADVASDAAATNAVHAVAALPARIGGLGGAPTAFGAAPSTIGPRPAAAGQAAAAVGPAAARTPPPGRVVSAPVPTAELSSLDAADRQPAAALPDEVVQVFHADGAVSIVIRDRRLGDEAAVRCALETARQLTGDARGLRQVTLNGRAIYAGGPLLPDQAPAPGRRVISFTC